MPTFGKLGRHPRDHSRYAPRLADYLTGPLAVTGLPYIPPGAEVNRADAVQFWGMYLNDRIGDCTIAGACHFFMAMCAGAGQPIPTFSDAEVIRAYSAVSGYDPATGANDNGAQMQDVLEYLRTTGIPDATGKVHKVVAYAALSSPAGQEELAQVLDVFGAVYVGVSLQEAQEQQFSEGKPWSYVKGSPFIGGHAITLERRAAAGTGRLRYVTWGDLWPCTQSFQYHCAGPPSAPNGEAWAVISEDWLAANGQSLSGLDIAGLQADLRRV